MKLEVGEKNRMGFFFDKLLKLDLIKIKGYDKYNHPIYQLKESAYKYVETHNL